MIDRPSPTNHLEMLDPTSNAWKDHEDNVRGDGLRWRNNFQRIGISPPKCQQTEEYRRIQSDYLAAQVRSGRLALVLKQFIYHQSGLRESGSEWSLVSREPKDMDRFKRAANSLHKFIAEVKFEKDAEDRRMQEAHEKMIAMEMAEHEANNKAHPELTMAYYLEKYT